MFTQLPKTYSNMFTQVHKINMFTLAPKNQPICLLSSLEPAYMFTQLPREPTYMFTQLSWTYLYVYSAP